MDREHAGCPLHEEMKEQQKELLENDRRLAESLSDIKERVVKNLEYGKSAHRRLDSQEEQTKAIVKMSTSIEYMARQVEDMLVLLKEHDGRLDKLERAPGDSILNYWKLFVGALITGGTGVIVGALISNV